MNVLLLEDEPELSDLARAQLEAQGYTVFQAYTLVEAREILEAHEVPIDVFIADHDVPGGAGSRLAIQVKGMSRDIRVVVVSGRLNIQDVEELEAHGIDYFNKPLLYAEIVDELIRAHL